MFQIHSNTNINYYYYLPFENGIVAEVEEFFPCAHHPWLNEIIQTNRLHETIPYTPKKIFDVWISILIRWKLHETVRLIKLTIRYFLWHVGRCMVHGTVSSCEIFVKRSISFIIKISSENISCFRSWCRLAFNVGFVYHSNGIKEKCAAFWCSEC